MTSAAPSWGARGLCGWWSLSVRFLSQRTPLRCPYCHADVELGAVVACDTCSAAHHASCWSEHPSCGSCRGGSARVLALTSAPTPKKEQAARRIVVSLKRRCAGLRLDGVRCPRTLVGASYCKQHEHQEHHVSLAAPASEWLEETEVAVQKFRGRPVPEEREPGSWAALWLFLGVGAALLRCLC